MNSKCDEWDTLIYLNKCHCTYCRVILTKCGMLLSSLLTKQFKLLNIDFLSSSSIIFTDCQIVVFISPRTALLNGIDAVSTEILVYNPIWSRTNVIAFSVFISINQWLDSSIGFCHVLSKVQALFKTALFSINYERVIFFTILTK